MEDFEHIYILEHVAFEKLQSLQELEPFLMFLIRSTDFLS